METIYRFLQKKSKSSFIAQWQQVCFDAYYIFSLILKKYGNLKRILQKIKYSEYQWLICSDFKILCMILGQQSGNTKFPYYLSEWDSRARNLHWIRKEWPRRIEMILGGKNIQNSNLIEPKRVLLPPLHIKFGLMKQFVKALDKENKSFKYLTSKLLGV